MEWVLLADRKPQQGGIYLATDGMDISVCGYWPHIDPAWAHIETDRPITPTHWMSLPKLPAIYCDGQVGFRPKEEKNNETKNRMSLW